MRDGTWPGAEQAEGEAGGSHLGEVAHNVEALAVVLRHDVEEERVCVIVQGLVVEETLGQKTQVLGIALQRKGPVTALGALIQAWPLGQARQGLLCGPG